MFSLFCPTFRLFLFHSFFPPFLCRLSSSLSPISPFFYQNFRLCCSFLLLQSTLSLSVSRSPYIPSCLISSFFSNSLTKTRTVITCLPLSPFSLTSSLFFAFSISLSIYCLSLSPFLLRLLFSPPLVHSIFLSHSLPPLFLPFSFT